MKSSLIRAMVLLPGTVLVFVPAALLWLSRHTPCAAVPTRPNEVLFWLAAAALLAGFSLVIWTVTLFLTLGRGTPAPWDPPKDLVVRGPYRHVRNPMITGVLLTLLAEAFFFQSWPLAVWMGVFFLANVAYFPCVEERGLERRFGDAYIAYRNNVRRWIPRLRPWDPPDSRSGV